MSPLLALIVAILHAAAQKAASHFIRHLEGSQAERLWRLGERKDPCFAPASGVGSLAARNENTADGLVGWDHLTLIPAHELAQPLWG
jgi:hypothetical protein